MTLEVVEVKDKMEAALEHLRQEFRALRSSRAHPGMIESVVVELYGTSHKIKELASITTVDFRQLLITPYDPQTTGVIAKSIEKENLNLQPRIEGNMIRILVPPMDSTVRQNIVKQAKGKTEDLKVRLREIRRKSNEAVRKGKSEGLYTEDQVKKFEKRIQELTDLYCKSADDLCANKEKEILAV